MPWLWYVAPFVVVLLYMLTGLPGRHERRRTRELARWKEYMAPESEDAGPNAFPPEVRVLPGDLQRALPEAGEGIPVAYYELFEKLAYVAVMGPSWKNGSEYQAVVARLARPAPELRVYPLAIVDGKRLPSTGVQIKKDPELMALMQVEGKSAKLVSKWLTRPVRNALKDLPEVWLYARGSVMVLALYGPVDPDRLYALVQAADAIFAEHGAEGGPSLFLDEDDREGGSEDAGDEDEAGEEDEAPAEVAKGKKAEPKAEAKAAAPQAKAGQKKGSAAAARPKG